MIRTTLAAALGAALSVLATAQDQWWCGGDGNRNDALACERNTSVPDARTYDDFDVPVRASVRGAWGNFYLSYGLVPKQAYYEIRSGVSQGNGGTLVASGTMNVQVRPTGRFDLEDWEEMHVRGAFPEPIALDPGRYWITVAPVGNGSGRAFVAVTTGRDEPPDSEPTPPPLGTPRLNHNSFFDSPYFGHNFVDTRTILGWWAPNWDFCFGVGPDTPPPFRLLPESFEVTFGEYVQGELGDLLYGDGRRIVIQQRLYPSASAPNAQIVVDTTAPHDRAGYICLEFVSCVTASPQNAVIQRISFFDHLAKSWVTADEAPADAYKCYYAYASVSLDMDRFIEPQTRRVRAALSWFDRGAVSLDWSATIDFIQFVAEQR